MKQPYLLVTSLPLQIFLYYHFYFWAVYALVTTFTFIYKVAVLPYPRDIFNWEVSTFVFLVIIDISRLLLASKGNKTQHRTALIISCALCGPVITGNVFFLELQTYILRLDYIVNLFGLIASSCELVLSIFTIISFSQNRSASSNLMSMKNRVNFDQAEEEE
mmetsp:Transcript_43498/g.85152  ORF Transcript_43498/g.85152 Transcript_43498/m.85152 type:complete len:162 (-) Transcript_43498:51-536(-)